MSRAKATSLVLSLMFLVSAYASASQKLVSFNPSVKSAERMIGIEKAGGQVIQEFHLIDAVVAVFPDDVRDSRIYQVAGVTTVEEDLYQKWIEDAGALPLSAVTAGLKAIQSGETVWTIPAPVKPTPEETEIPWGIKRVNAPGAWATTEGTGVKVGIIDTGIDYNHPDLAANYKGGFNAIVSTATPLDDHGHGTHVSGTVAAVRDAKGVVGVAPKAMLYGIKVMDARGSGTFSNIISGIQWAVDNKMNVVNMSIGGKSGSVAFANSITAAYKAGVTLVCAAGNDSGAVNYPAKYPEAIAVSASDSADKIASFSSRGPEVAFIAPGVDIYSSFKGGGYKSSSGTSMATPHVTGLAALAISKGADTPDKVRAALKLAATPLGLPAGQEGAGMINAAKIQ